MPNGCRAYIEQVGDKQGDAMMIIYGTDESFRLKFLSQVGCYGSYLC